MAEGMLLVLSGPSGAGKGTLGGMLLKDDPSFRFSVSATTRKPREYEVHGKHYYFMSDAEYDRALAQGLFLEHATVHGHRYGTLREHVMEQVIGGFNVLLDVDPQGAQSVVADEPSCVSVFILPPSYEELAKRLRTRNMDRPSEIQRRMMNARGEIAQMYLYNYIIINDTVDSAYSKLQAIILAEKHRSNRYCPDIPEKGIVESAKGEVAHAYDKPVHN
ncbi:MAG: guanylate kinase [Oscillospiraceae bacterium]|jgi:guanylate kinase|nr:guanylate kinase [Oscillospiraceae bacterium]